MEENNTMQQTSSSEPKTNRKRKWLRSCLIVFLGYLVVSLVIVLCLGGCCTIQAIDYIWPKDGRLEDRRFELSPDGSAILYSSVLRVYRPDIVGDYTIRQEKQHFEKRIPLDPVPDGMFPFTLVVEENPSKPHPEILSGSVAQFTASPVRHVSEERDPVLHQDQSIWLWPGGTFVLPIHPEDMDKLSRPFCIMVPEYAKPYDPSRIKPVLVFPRGKIGKYYDVLTAERPLKKQFDPGGLRNEYPHAPWHYTLGNYVFWPQPFEEEYDAIAVKETHGKVKGGLFLVGGAVLLDIVLLPAEALYWIGREIYRRF